MPGRVSFHIVKLCNQVKSTFYTKYIEVQSQKAVNKTWPQILIKMASKIDKLAPIQTCHEKLIKWHQFKTWPPKSIKWRQTLIKWHQFNVCLSAAQYSPIQPSTAQHSPAQPSTVQYSPGRPSKAKYSPLQPSTAQCSPGRPSTA